MQYHLVAQRPAMHRAYLSAALVGSYLISYLYIDWFLLADYDIQGYEQLAFVLCFFTGGECLARCIQRQRRAPYPKEATFWLVCGICIAASFALSTFLQKEFHNFSLWNDRYSSGTIHIYAAFVLHAIAAYWVVCRFGQLCQAKTSSWFCADLLNALVIFPFAGFFLRIKLFWAGLYHLVRGWFAQKIQKKTFFVTALVIVLFGGFFCVAASLLAASDVVFSDFLQQFQFALQWKFSFLWGDFWGNFFLSLPVGAYFFSLYVRCMQPKQPTSALAQELEKGIRVSKAFRLVSARILIAIITCFVALYLLYFGVQAEYYLAAFGGNLPQRFTFSQYARQGFFELCKLMALNFVLLLAVAKLSLTPLASCRGLRCAADAVLGCSLLFAATAIAKLVLYIYVYGITDLRLLSAWWIAVLVVGVLLCLQKIYKQKVVARQLLYFAVASFTLLCFAGV